MTGPADSATAEAESFLREEYERNHREGIYPSRNRVIERLLARRADLTQDLYPELYHSLPRAEQRRAVLLALVHVAAFGNPERVAHVRQQVDKARAIDLKIQDLALQMHRLVDLLEQRREECPDVAPLALPPVLHVLRAATDYSAPDTGYLFDTQVLPQVGRFDWQYWPALEGLMTSLANELMNATAEDRPIRADDPLMHRVTSGGNRSRADFTRAVDAVLAELHETGHPPLPANFSLSSRAIDAFVAVTLDLEPGDSTIRKQRHRAKSRTL